jgi:hypothetical protein
MTLAGLLAWITTRLYKRGANVGVSRARPELASSLCLRGVVAVSPFEIEAEPAGCIANGGAVRACIEVIAVAFTVVQAKMLRCRHALDICRPMLRRLKSM